jgi:hypothetical protein
MTNVGRAIIRNNEYCNKSDALFRIVYIRAIFVHLPLQILRRLFKTVFNQPTMTYSHSTIILKDILIISLYKNRGIYMTVSFYN